MAAISVAILGLGRLGASLALALRRYNARKDAPHQFSVTACERRPPVMQEVKKLALAESYTASPFEAVREKDIVILAGPYSETAATYEAIARDLREGAVVLDTAPIKLPSLASAKKHLKAETYAVGVTPVLNPALLFDGSDETGHAREDLFDQGGWLVVAPPDTVKEAVELAMDFGRLLGMTPHFMDAAEHDALAAGTEGVPALLGVMSYYALSRSAAWGDMQRLTNPSFAALTHHLYDTHPDDLRDHLFANREAVLRYLDEVLGALREVRRVLAANDKMALEAALVESAKSYEEWYNRRYKGMWDNPRDKSDAPDLVTTLFGSFLAKKMRGKKE